MQEVNKTRKNILFLMTDQHRNDYVGYSGLGKIKTPNIDRIAEGVSFNNAISPNPVCTPTRCSLLTGKYSHQISMLTMSGDLSVQHPTYMQALQKAGYYTAGIGKFHFLQGWQWGTKRGLGHNLFEQKDRIKEFGFDDVWEASGKQLNLQNYCDYAKHLEDKGVLEVYRNHVDFTGTEGAVGPKGIGVQPSPIAFEDYVDVVIGDKIVEHIANRPADKPFCIFGSFCSPHPPFDPPKEYLESTEYEEDDDFIVAENQKAMSPEIKRQWYAIRRAYKAMIKLVDDQIGRIFAQLESENILNDTVILFCADHGEMLGDKSLYGKSVPWRFSATVPAAIRHPDYLTGNHINPPIELTDLTATILDVAGLDPAKALSRDWPSFHAIVPCKSLLPILKGTTDKVRDFAFCEYYDWDMLVNEEWKYIVHKNFTQEYCSPQEELYNLISDPTEIRNVATDCDNEEILEYFRKRHHHILISTPPAQTRWSPLMDEKDLNLCGIDLEKCRS